MHTKFFCHGLLGGVMLLTAGCSLPSKGPMVPATQAGQLQKSETGVILKVHDVTIEGQRTHLGSYGGGIIGGAAAVPPGGVSGRGDALAVAGASVVGAIAGGAVEEYATRKRAQEITIRMDNGDEVTIVQEAPPDYMVGDHVQVIHSAAGARVALAMEY